jgi:hypothetical protein
LRSSTEELLVLGVKMDDALLDDVYTTGSGTSVPEDETVSSR